MATQEITKYTRQSVSDLLQSRWESDLPDRVLDALKPFAGKLITTRLLDKLPGGREDWRLHRNYGWTELSNMAYITSRGETGLRLILARSEASVPLDLAFVEVDNPAYLAGRRERNHARMEARNTAELLDKMADALNAVTSARAVLAAAEARLSELTEYGEPFSPDKYTFDRLLNGEK